MMTIPKRIFSLLQSKGCGLVLTRKRCTIDVAKNSLLYFYISVLFKLFRAILKTKSSCTT